MRKTRWYARSIYFLVALALALGFTLTPVVPMAGTLEAQVGVTYYVNATTGDDSRTAEEAKSPDTPWLTIQHAIDTVPEESTGKVAAGTYNENLDIRKSLTIKGENKATTFIVSPEETWSGWQPCINIQANNTKISGFDVTREETLLTVE
jgi:hypothetical protein